MRLEGKVAVVTGAGQGIGRAVAELFAREGARLVLNDLNRSTGEATCRLARKAGAHAELVAGDVSMPNTAKKLVVTALRHFDRIDVLVNNAGIGGSAHGDGPVTESREDSWDKILRVNLKSVFLCCRFAIPEMVRSGGGAVINLSSVLAFDGIPRRFLGQDSAREPEKRIPLLSFCHPGDGALGRRRGHQPLVGSGLGGL